MKILTGEEIRELARESVGRIHGKEVTTLQTALENLLVDFGDKLMDKVKKG